MIRVPLPKQKKPRDPLAAAAREVKCLGKMHRKILYLLAERGIGHVNQMTEALGVKASSITTALKDLRDAKVVIAQWESYDSLRWTYRLNPASGLAIMVQEIYNKNQKKKEE